MGFTDSWGSPSHLISLAPYLLASKCRWDYLYPKYIWYYTVIEHHSSLGWTISEIGLDLIDWTGHSSSKQFSSKTPEDQEQLNLIYHCVLIQIQCSMSPTLKLVSEAISSSNTIAGVIICQNHGTRKTEILSTFFFFLISLFQSSISVRLNILFISDFNLSLK